MESKMAKQHLLLIKAALYTKAKKRFFFGLLIFCFPLGIQAFSLYFTNYFLNFNNADFENYDSELYRQNQAVNLRNSDDEHYIAYGDLRLRYNTGYGNSEFFVDASRSGFWGTDNYQGRDDGQNAIYFNRLYFIYYPSETTKLSMGRQKYEIGDSRWDYFFSDVIDGIDFAYQIFEPTSISIMADIVSNSVKTDETGIYGVVDKDDEEVEDFRGDTVTYRAGLNINQSLIKDNLGMRVFAYHLRYAANTQGGADLAESGRNSYNKPDRDYLNMAGIRIYANDLAEALSFDLTYAYADGKDRQFENEHVYNNSATALNVIWKHNFSSTSSNEVWFSAGYFSDGFASMKARSMGGMLLWGYKGYHAAPYAYFYHFRDYAKREDSIQYIDRTNSKTFGKIKEELDIGRFKGSLACLGLWETKSGQYMGTEVELELQYRVDNLKFSNTTAMFAPTDYYRDRAVSPDGTPLNNFLPSGKHTFYGIRISVEYVLDLNFVTSKKKPVVEDKTEELLELEKESIE